MIERTIEQADILINVKSKGFNDEWGSEIIRVLGIGLYFLYGWGKIESVKKIWKSLKPLANKMFNHSRKLANKRINTLFALENFYTTLMWQNENANCPMPRADFVGKMWLIKAAIVSLNRDVEISSLASNLKNKQRITEFLDEYSDAVLKAKKLKDSLKVVYNRLVEELNRLGVHLQTLT